MILKNIIAVEDWDRINDHIQFDFVYDNQFAELKESELMDGRLATLATIEPYIGRFYSQDWVRRKVLRQSDTEIKEIDSRIEKEIEDGIIPDPTAVDPITGEPLPTEGDPNLLGDVPMEPDLTDDDVQFGKDIKKAEI